MQSRVTGFANAGSPRRPPVEVKQPFANGWLQIRPKYLEYNKYK